MISGRKRKSIWGFLASLVGSTSLQAINLVVIPLYLDLTSQEIYGLWLTLGSVLGWVSLGDMGLGMALTRNAISSIEKCDYESLRKLIYGAGITFLFLGVIFSGTGYFLTDLLIDMFKIRPELIGDFRLTYYILLLVPLIGPSLGVFGSVIEAEQHIAFLRISSTIITVLSIFLNLLLLYLGFGIVSFALGLLFKVLMTPFVQIVYLKKIDERVEFFPVETTRYQIKELFKFGGLFQILKIANLISTSTDNIIIASVLGASFVSIYTFTSKLVFLFAVGIISIAPSVLFPGLSQLFDQGNNEKLTNLYLRLSKISLRMGLIFGTFYYAVNDVFVTLWVGKDNYGGDQLTFIFVFWILIESFLRGITAIIYASSKLKLLSIISFTEALLNILITLLLIKKLGLVGVALGTIFSRFVTCVFVPLFINRLLNVKSVTYFKGTILEALIYSIPMIVVVALVKNDLTTILNPIIYILILGIITVIMNTVFFEGLFLIKQKNKGFFERIKVLQAYYF